MSTLFRRGRPPGSKNKVVPTGNHGVQAFDSERVLTRSQKNRLGEALRSNVVCVFNVALKSVCSVSAAQEYQKRNQAVQQIGARVDEFVSEVQGGKVLVVEEPVGEPVCFEWLPFRETEFARVPLYSGVQNRENFNSSAPSLCPASDDFYSF